jgi:hypothetical protein
MTPSGFSMGIILKTKVFLRNSAFSSSLMRYSMTPFIMKEEFVSPGWIRHVRIIAFLWDMASGLDAKFVTISISTSFPANDLHKTVRLILSLF